MLYESGCKLNKDGKFKKGKLRVYADKIAIEGANNSQLLIDIESIKGCYVLNGYILFNDTVMIVTNNATECIELRKGKGLKIKKIIDSKLT